MTALRCCAFTIWITGTRRAFQTKSDRNQPMTAPTAMPPAARKSLLRSSSRCWPSDIRPSLLLRFDARAATLVLGGWTGRAGIAGVGGTDCRRRGGAVGVRDGGAAVGVDDGGGLFRL